MKNYSFIILVAVVCLSALPSYAQDSSSTDRTVTPPVENIEAKEPTIDKQQPAPEPDKCESVDR